MDDGRRSEEVKSNSTYVARSHPIRELILLSVVGFHLFSREKNVLIPIAT